MVSSAPHQGSRLADSGNHVRINHVHGPGRSQHPGRCVSGTRIVLFPENLMKITVITPKPRNPIVAACLHRRAGAHRRSGGAQRLLAKRELQRELLKERHPCT